jgi:hypothetical protein
MRSFAGTYTGSKMKPNEKRTAPSSAESKKSRNFFGRGPENFLRYNVPGNVCNLSTYIWACLRSQMWSSNILTKNFHSVYK